MGTEDPEVALLSDEEFYRDLYAQGVRVAPTKGLYGNLPSRRRTRRWHRRMERRAAKFVNALKEKG